ncbi:MAG: hypothetical protein JOZ15_12575, partial [Acidobacteria bacterium]|nr:hypothetical protein [Acidobacteriota bacterium]
MKRGVLAASCSLLLVCGAAAAAAAKAGHAGQSEADDYTRYELLAPESSQFHILYEVTATSPGATAYFNPIRKGSEASGEAVRDRASGKPLAFEVVSGAAARQSGLPEAELDMSYLRIRLPRPVPAEGGVRLLIEKTYKDPKSYYREDSGRIVFARSLGIRRNAVVLPAGYELVSCNVPAQVLAEPDGRIKVSFMHDGPDAAALQITAMPSAAPGASPSAAPGASPSAAPGAAPPAAPAASPSAAPASAASSPAPAAPAAPAASPVTAAGPPGAGSASLLSPVAATADRRGERLGERSEEHT